MYCATGTLSLLRKTTVNVTKPDFGAWLKRKIENAGIPLTEISSLSRIAYPNLNSLVNSGKKGKPVQPEEGTLEKLAPVLKSLDLIEDEVEAWVAAGYQPEGYRIVSESQVNENKIDYIANPDTLRVAERYGNAPPKVRRAIDAMLDVVSDDDEEEAPSAARLAFDMEREGARGRRAE